MTTPVPPVPTPSHYVAGALKQDPDSKAVAVRTVIVSPDYSKDWGVMSIDAGGWYLTWPQVQNWADIPDTPVSVSGGTPE